MIEFEWEEDEYVVPYYITAYNQGEITAEEMFRLAHRDGVRFELIGDLAVDLPEENRKHFN